jgi:hypothetical protein
MVVFIGYRQLDNAFFFYLHCIRRYTFLFIKPFVYTTTTWYSLLFLRKKRKTDRYYVLREILYEILSLEASIQSEKIVNNNLQLDRLKLLLTEVLI